MNISVDAGGLCIRQGFGNFTFSNNFIKALIKYDKENQYLLYSFCKKNHSLKLKDNFKYKLLRPKRFWMKGVVTVEEIRNSNDVFLALNQASPLFSTSYIVSFCHGLSYYFYPKYYKKDYKRLTNQLNNMINKSNVIIVSSERVKKEINSIFSKTRKIKIVPFGIPFDLKEFKEKKRKKQFLFCGMNNEIKNVDFIINSFLIFISDKKYADYKLILVGPFQKQAKVCKNISCKPYLSRNKLIDLYRKSIAYLTASYYESFNFPVLEALSQKCQVIGLKTAIIPEFEKYVNTARNKKEFVDKLIEVAEKKNIYINRKELTRDFSWKKYVKEIKKCYLV